MCRRIGGQNTYNFQKTGMCYSVIKYHGKAKKCELSLQGHYQESGQSTRKIIHNLKRKF